MPQGPEHAPTTDAQAVEAARRAGWDFSQGDPPFEHGVFVEGLEVTDERPDGLE